MAGFGIDFGTTNSLASCVVGGNAVPLTTDNDRPHPSVVWYHGDEVKVGAEARAMLDSNTIGVSGDFVRSPKSLMGKGQPYHVGGRIVRPVDVVSLILRHLRVDAESRGLQGLDFSQAVFTIPVNMAGSERRELRDAATVAGIAVNQFVHEPFAALYAFARRQPDPERFLARIESRLALVFDWGGGTLDLTLCERIGDMLVQVQSLGLNTIGGDKFDERLMHLVESKHMRQYGWSEVKEKVVGQRAKLLASCEQAKITLSTKKSAPVVVRNLYLSPGSSADLAVEVSLDEFVHETSDLLDAGLKAIDDLLESAGQRYQAVEVCLPTGGVVAMPAVRERLLRAFGPSRCETVERGDTLIAEGAAWIAFDGVPLKLAKNIELRHADETWVPIVKAGRELPTRNSSLPSQVTVFCADPRDGYARIELARPKRSSRVQAADRRQHYGVFQVEVSRVAAPLREPIKLNVTIDHDLIIQVSAQGAAGGPEARTEFHELEFGIGLRREGSGDNADGSDKQVVVESLDSKIRRMVRDFESKQIEASNSRWVGLNDQLLVAGQQRSLNSAIRDLVVQDQQREPDSVITLLQSLGIACVNRRGQWIATIGGADTPPVVPRSAPVGPTSSIVLRSNISLLQEHLATIPGDLVDVFHPGFTGSSRATDRQRDELRWARR